ncbi:polysaccharide deacetylase family protein [Botryobacter ruber]|uniref:polysaccharide deacetylase family protein n=1 Tax=Botryobacter ruber TaxID=2171629 RepID=UPI000E0C4741|nr:polysaccharide deacetylase family protein [Botryobacter ruber]
MVRYLIDRFLKPQALVLMYHRVAVPAADAWDIAVSPENFEQQLQVLKNTANVIPLKELVERVKRKKVEKSTVALTFDDGYVDNYQVAKQLLEKYGLPATFFISSGNVGKDAAFWWDELEQLILYTPQLPDEIALAVGGEQVAMHLGEEAQLTGKQLEINRSWRACEEVPPSGRCALFLKLWQRLKPLPAAVLQEQLQLVRNWADAATETRPATKSMSVAQLQELAQHSLFDIGAHTVSHPALASHSLEYQKAELEVNKQYLQETINKEVSLLSYPYGNYNHDTLTAAADAAFEAAFTTEARAVTNRSHPYRLGRFQVKNLAEPAFLYALEHWKRLNN